MLKAFLKKLFITLFSFYLASLILSGVLVFTGVRAFIIGVVFISLANIILRPLINLIMLPFTIITFGILRWLANLVVIYLLDALVPGVDIFGFVWPHPPLVFSYLSALLLCTLVISLLYAFFNWLFSD